MSGEVRVDPALRRLWPRLAPGVIGNSRQAGDVLVVTFVAAEVEGSGAVGAWLDSLEPTVRITNVLNDRLAGMLRRRGWELVPDKGLHDYWLR